MRSAFAVRLRHLPPEWGTLPRFFLARAGPWSFLPPTRWDCSTIMPGAAVPYLVLRSREPGHTLHELWSEDSDFLTISPSTTARQKVKRADFQSIPSQARAGRSSFRDNNGRWFRPPCDPEWLPLGSCGYIARSIASRKPITDGYGTITHISYVTDESCALDRLSSHFQTAAGSASSAGPSITLWPVYRSLASGSPQLLEHRKAVRRSRAVGLTYAGVIGSTWYRGRPTYKTTAARSAVRLSVLTLRFLVYL